MRDGQESVNDEAKARGYQSGKPQGGCWPGGSLRATVSSLVWLSSAHNAEIPQMILYKSNHGLIRAHLCILQDDTDLGP